MRETLVELSHVCKFFDMGKDITLKAVDDISFCIYKGESLGLVGAQGCGKSTLAKVISGAEATTSGSITYRGQPLPPARDPAQRLYAPHIQMIFEEPDAGLAPSMTVGEYLAHTLERVAYCPSTQFRSQVVEMLELVELDASKTSAFPHQLTEIERQKVAIARALCKKPELLIYDEPLSGYANSLLLHQLLVRIHQKLGLTYLLMDNDLSLIGHFCDRLGVVCRGRLVELGPAQEIIHHPLHPYTRWLFHQEKESQAHSSIGKQVVSSDDLNSLVNPGPGCRHALRCARAGWQCHQYRPPVINMRPDHWVACWEYGKSGTQARP